jgi:hypothetical protein
MNIEASVEIPIAVFEQCKYWLAVTFGPAGVRWTRSAGYYVDSTTTIRVSFADKADATFFALRWKEFE